MINIKISKNLAKKFITNNKKQLMMGLLSKIQIFNLVISINNNTRTIH